jgi:uncharacterized protein YutE (UPF0331/DUF86 family)
VSPLIDRLAQLFRHLQHLRQIRPQVTNPEVLSSDLTLQNDVLHSLQIVCQAVIDIASELSARRMLRLDDYTQAVRNLAAYPEFSPSLVRRLEKLPAFRNVLVHEYVDLDFTKVVEALDDLEAVEEFAGAVYRMDRSAEG